MPLTTLFRAGADLLSAEHVVQDTNASLAPSRVAADFTLDNYRKSLRSNLVHQLLTRSPTCISTGSSVTVALPAAYAFSRYRFVGDKHLFFWLLTNRMAPPAVFALPFFQLYSAIGLFDTHIAVALAHCLFNIPLAVWILEGFMSGVPKELDETAFVDGYPSGAVSSCIFPPTIAAGIGVAAFCCFMFSWWNGCSPLPSPRLPPSRSPRR